MKKKNLSVKKKIHNFYSKKLDDPRIKRIYFNFILITNPGKAWNVVYGGLLI